ncbi:MULTISPECIES: 2OG-Fe(II) oxygenase [Acinetobacter]|uniref:2OG-Fe(II) oxygenase n=1 Tax=Acinetobacter variabilis TaxID=70346 RepID=A0A7T7WIK3_9GAMM|nr:MULTISPECIES: 2OG-Fe(II) oxygenase [Acinetobacter]NHB65868.1 2OG-Fe(II) oxygenase [Acinetobacter sp. GFQ9D191M]NHC02145.1 2OG-Fe(II) oxygenase [Acinetobacter sp. GFQ9D192M]QQN87682.1 2OG-Fe(II) oxygenase [Acinetobacter variabilis]UNW07358.1 2OG-Fe(II) oxygenase [Acinetobacter variabilis]WKT73758.1 2OG-Fe(II) oxygenase [Acinetobacter variabilis]
MEAVQLPATWPVDQIIDDLDQHGFSMIDNAYAPSYVEQLIAECTSNLERFRDAAIQNGVVSNIRSDHILWLNEDLEISNQHVQTLQALGHELNRAFFLGIKDVEAHFACYNAGEFYALHRDNPQGKNGRMISAVYYLHDDWQDNWGGELHLQDKNDQWHIIQPKPNRIAFFQSDLMHEVLKAKHQRLSITAWLRSDTCLL